MSRAAGRLAVEGLYLLVWGAGVAVTLLFFRLRATAAPPGGEVELRGLAAPVDVAVDPLGIPHVFAGGVEDLLRSQGFLHARDRLWQIELLRRIAAGRLAELFGEPALGADRFARALDVWGAAARMEEALDPRERALLEAYAAGVDAGIASFGRVLPPEFVLLRFRPAAWSVRSSLALGALMSLDLSHWRSELQRHVAASLLPAAKLAHLRLPFPGWGPTILPDPVPVPGRETVRVLPGLGPVRVGRVPMPAPSWEALEPFAAHAARAASNAWVVAPTRSADGRAILANDTHLGLRAPSTWYLSALHAREAGLHVVGFSLAGVPGVVIGHNRGVAWGMTNGMVDDMDFVVEESSPDGTRYRLGEGWAAYAVREETIAVRGRAAPEVLRVRETVRGPLLSDVLPGLGDDLSAVWVTARPTWSSIGLLGMNAAETGAAFDRALASFAAPHQNVVFATTAGEIGYRLAGTLPVRRGWDGTRPVERERLEAEGLGHWPREAHPAGRDPESGFVATANNLQAPGLDGVIGADYPPPFRARRIVDRLAEETRWTPAATLDLQRDTRSLLADRVLGRAVRAARAAGAEPVAALLESWDRRVSVESRAAPILYAWLYRLRELVAADEFAPAPGWAFYPLAALLHTLEAGDGDPWVDDVRTPERETLDALSERAMRDVLPRVGGRRWGEVHLELHRHPLGESPLLDRLFGFRVGPYPAPGGPHTVRPDDYGRWSALDSTSWSPPWRGDFGPSQRFVATLGPDGIRGSFLLPTGQSGNPFSPHYRDMHPRWRGDGDPVAVPLEEEAARAPAARRYRLVPPAERGAR